MNFKEASIQNLKNGYYTVNNTHICLYCNHQVNLDAIYQIEGKFFKPHKAMHYHVNNEHQGAFQAMITRNKDDHGLTDRQKEILQLLYLGKKDREIADELKISESTIRHQRFVLKEKANQARVFLGMYELLNERSEIDDFISLHKYATQIDERYENTNAEEQKIVQDCFYENSKLKKIPKKQKHKIVVFRKIIELFEFNKQYSEKETNEIIKTIFDDYVTIRRYLIEYGFLDRSRDCSVYYRK